MSTTYHPPAPTAGTPRFASREVEPLPVLDAPCHVANLEESIKRLGFTVEVFQVASGWFAAIFQPGQNCALGVAVDQPNRATALSKAIDDAMKATQFDFRSAPQPRIDPVKRRRSLAS